MPCQVTAPCLHSPQDGCNINGKPFSFPDPEPLLLPVSWRVGRNMLRKPGT